jgi:hypothetical protein
VVRFLSLKRLRQRGVPDQGGAVRRLCRRTAPQKKTSTALPKAKRAITRLVRAGNHEAQHLPLWSARQSP